MVEIAIRSKSRSFDLKFQGKFNFLVGNSGSHKTHFINLCNKRLMGVNYISGNFRIDGMRLHSDHIVVYLNSNVTRESNYRNDLLSLHNSLFIIDGFCSIFKMHDLPSLLQQSDNYFIFITRTIFKYLPINEMSVYALEKDKHSGDIVNVPVFSKRCTEEIMVYPLTSIKTNNEDDLLSVARTNSFIK